MYQNLKKKIKKEKAKSKKKKKKEEMGGIVRGGEREKEKKMIFCFSLRYMEIVFKGSRGKVHSRIESYMWVLKSWSLVMSRPDSRSDLIEESEPGSGRETIYGDSLLIFSDIGGLKSYNIIKILCTKLQNKTTTVVVFTVSNIQYRVPFTYSKTIHLHY